MAPTGSQTVTTPPGKDVLTTLSQSIADNIEVVRQEHEKRGLAPLSVDAALLHSTDNPAVEALPSVRERKARDGILSATSKIAAIVDHPVSRMAKLSSAYLDVAVLHFAADHGIADVIEKLSSSPDGALSATEIAAQIHTDPGRTARLLRYLTALHVFRETTEGCFANNRYSLHMKKGSPLDAVFGMGVNDVGPAALRINQFMKTQRARNGDKEDSTGHLPFNLHFGYPDKSLFSWMNEPFNEARLARFNRTMVMKSYDSYAVVADVPWDATIPPGGTLVDVGGGIGSLAASVLRTRTDIHVVVQDQKPVIEQARHFWAQEMRGASVQLLVHDFFAQNPTQEADLYVFRAVFHNWNDECCAAILKATVASMAPLSRILVIDAILNPTTEDSKNNPSVNELRSDTQQDITMMTLFPSLERTRRDWDRLFASVGLEIKTVFPVRSRKTAFEVGSLSSST